MREIVFQLLDEFYYRLSLILEQKYRDTDKSITRGEILYYGGAEKCNEQ